MFNTPEHVAEFGRSAVDAALQFAKISFDSTERFLNLQLAASKETLADTAKQVKELVEAKDPQEFFNLRNKLAEAGVEKVMSYSRNVYELATQTQAEVSQLVEERVA